MGLSVVNSPPRIVLSAIHLDPMAGPRLTGRPEGAHGHFGARRWHGAHTCTSLVDHSGDCLEKSEEETLCSSHIVIARHLSCFPAPHVVSSHLRLTTRI